MKVKDVMTSSVMTCVPTATIRELWKHIFSKHVNAIPVIDKKRHLLGIITKEDLLKKLYPDYREFFEDILAIGDFEKMEDTVKEIGGKMAREIMCPHVVFTRYNDPVMRALSRMIARRLNQLPVLSDTDEVIGLITKGDIFYALFKKELKK
jgi:CBS domain-containing membrane protein